MAMVEVAVPLWRSLMLRRRRILPLH